MKRRMLILLALVAGFVDMSYAQSPPLNCTHGSWQIAGEPYKDNGCNNSVTDQRIVNEQCTTTSGASNPGETYWTYQSSVTGTGQHYCKGAVFPSPAINYVCNPYMNMYEVDAASRILTERIRPATTIASTIKNSTCTIQGRITPRILVLHLDQAYGDSRLADQRWCEHCYGRH